MVLRARHLKASYLCSETMRKRCGAVQVAGGWRTGGDNYHGDNSGAPCCPVKLAPQYTSVRPSELS